MKLPLLIPRELPIATHADEISSAIQSHQVIIVSGDTGSGKTTQLPKIALNAGRGKKGLIGCTQPRRLAAFTMAKRVASELHQELGGFVGCQHRFEKIISAQTRLKFMTDGILLAETRNDRFFKRYDTIIIDEAHERSLNIDFLLGILKRVIRKRRDLKIIISSATLDVERFSSFFNDAPVISVPGRIYPIELRWRPPQEKDDADLSAQIANACDELICDGEGDILVFLPGEHDIRDAAETLKGRRLPQTEIIPLLASLPAAEQQRAFTTSSNRRIILSTNVAETSVTIPGIRYVVDSGLVRLNRYSHRTQVQRLLIEAVSQASANQRKGRCGRVAPGICIRLYAQDDFKKRDVYTPPEILRTSLAGVILTMMDLNLGDIDTFPFIEPPSIAIIKEGYRKLDLLGAIKPASNIQDDSRYTLTRLGRQLSHLPIGPALGAILFAADREKALRDTLIVVAALECNNPKRRPIDKKAEADRLHARFLSSTSDFSGLLRLWRWYTEESGATSQSRRRKLCKENFLSYPKMREWIDLHGQIKKICKQLKLDVESYNGGEDGMHRALLRGLISNIGHLDPETNEYQGTRGIRFSIFPGSGLAKFKEQKSDKNKKQFKHGHKQISREWVLTGDLVETSRLFARQTACISPEWIEPIARNHCKYQYWAEHWDGRRGFVSVKERVTFFGLVIADGRNRDFSRIDPDAARRIFIRDGLLQSDFPAPRPEFLKKNLLKTDALLDLETKMRSEGALFDPEVAVGFYDERLPQKICNAAQLRQWIKEADPALVDSLIMRDEDLPAAGNREHDFPEHITLKGTRFKLIYCYDQGADNDGITCETPVAMLPVVAQWPSEWLVPGALDEKLRWMIHVLPSKYRRLLQPVAETIAICRTYMEAGLGSLPDSFSDAIYRARSVRVPPEIWLRDDWPNHLRVRYFVFDDEGKELSSSRDLSDLIDRYSHEIKEPAESSAVDSHWNQKGINSWDFGDLPEQVDIGKSGWPVINFPALVDKQESVSIQLFADKNAALAAHQAGVCRLIAIALGKSCKRYFQTPSISNSVALYLTQLEISSRQLGAEIGRAALRESFTEGRRSIRSKVDFEERLESCYGKLHAAHTARSRLVISVLNNALDLEEVVGLANLVEATQIDIFEQLAWLVFPGFAESVPGDVLEHYPRYMEACRIRIQRAQGNPNADLRKLDEFTPHWRKYLDFSALKHSPHHDKELLNQYRWLLEEFRVSLFAQELKTARPVSSKRLRKLWETIFVEKVEK
ncbi:MAG: ATP-dependent RNA helicase HrpA [Kiritimatiellae bacterium]|nr:ATP-dependent RNA helicase HrpA [Kiritimatiellia bacterium]